MKPVFDQFGARLFHGDCIEVMRGLPDASVHAVVTDPPYGLANTDPAHVAETISRWVNGERDYLPGGTGFMGKAWDAFVPPVAVWDECLRVLKPGGHLLAFAGSRTLDLMTLGIRLAGFEIRDSIAWLYGSGFPKSLDVSKAITATQTLGGSSRTLNRRAMTGDESRSTSLGSGPQTATTTATTRPPERANLTPDAEKWEGWGTALKPAFEPIVVGRKPLAGTVAGNVLAHGTGALNIDATRIPATDGYEKAWDKPVSVNAKNTVVGNLSGSTERKLVDLSANKPSGGRWPTNVVLDESQAAALDEQSGTPTSGKLAAHHARAPKEAGILGAYGSAEGERGYGDCGGESRFFPTFRYEAKAPSSERPTVDGVSHPTVKPVALMRWLVRLVTPSGGTVLEPFAGSGTTLEAALAEGFDVIGIEREADYLPLIEQRLARPITPALDIGEIV